MQQWPEAAYIAEIAAFAAVAELASFTKAAAALQRDATVLSKRVQALEIRLGVRLLDRTTRRVSTTEAGAALLRRSRAILEALAEAEQEAANFATGEPRGILRLSLPTTFGRMWIGPYLPEFLAKHSEVRIEVEFSNRFVDLIGEGFDAAVRLGTLPDSSLVARKIAPRRRLLCASPDFVSRYGVPLRPEDLKRMPCLQFTGFSFHPIWEFANTDGERVSFQPSGPLVSDDAEALVAAAVQGLGVMLSTDWLTGREIADRRLIALLPHWLSEDEGAIFALTPSNRLIASKTRAFVDWIAARFTPIPPWSRGTISAASTSGQKA